jgi:hypothetical protein
MLRGYNLPGRQHIRFHNDHGILLSRIKLSQPRDGGRRRDPVHDPGQNPARRRMGPLWTMPRCLCSETGRCVPGTDTDGRPRAASGRNFSRNHAESRPGSDRYDASRCGLRSLSTATPAGSTGPS